eukprot:349660-Chlamydomonas_euryale.AAC.2
MWRNCEGDQQVEKENGRKPSNQEEPVLEEEEVSAEAAAAAAPHAAHASPCSPIHLHVSHVAINNIEKGCCEACGGCGVRSLIASTCDISKA